MDDYLKNQTQQNLTKAQNVLVIVSKESEFDGLASGLTLYLSLKKLGKNASIFANAPTVGDAKTLYAVDKIGKAADKKNLVIIVDNAVKNVEKVTYFLEQDKLKIVIHSFPSSSGVAQDDITYEESLSKPDLIFTIGINSADELRNEITHEQIINPEAWIVSINRSIQSQKFAQVDINQPQAASISEITTSIFQTLSLPIDEDIAFNLYSGIFQSTKMFSPNFSKPSSLEAALYLIKFGAGKAGLANSNQKPTNLPKTTNDTGLNLPKDTKSFYDEAPDRQESPAQEVEAKEKSRQAWLKPPKIYRGSKSFDTES